MRNTYTELMMILYNKSKNSLGENYVTSSLINMNDITLYKRLIRQWKYKSKDGSTSLYSFNSEQEVYLPIQSKIDTIENLFTELRLYYRQHAIEQINTLFNLNMSIEMRHDHTDKMLQQDDNTDEEVAQPTDVVKVRYQFPAEDVIESVVLLSNRQRAKAVTIRLESQNGAWRATNIGFL
jgi:hypothetical protein